jgi:hypothetical protein
VFVGIGVFVSGGVDIGAQDAKNMNVSEIKQKDFFMLFFVNVATEQGICGRYNPLWAGRLTS